MPETLELPPRKQPRSAPVGRPRTKPRTPGRRAAVSLWTCAEGCGYTWSPRKGDEATQRKCPRCQRRYGLQLLQVSTSNAA
jgi:hypothetical protein